MSERHPTEPIRDLSDEDERWVRVGVITRPHGVRGELRVHPFNPDSSLWPKLKRVALVHLDAQGEESRREERLVKRAKAAAKYVILVLDGCESREAAEDLRSVEVHVPREALPDLDGDEFYYVDLEGLAVVDPDGEPLGEVVQVLEYPAVDCLEVRCEGGYREVPLAAPWLAGVDVEREQVIVAEFEELPLRAR